MRRSLLTGVVLLLACGPGHPPEAAPPAHSSFKSFALRLSADPAFEAALAALSGEKLATELVSRPAGLIHTVWGPAQDEPDPGAERMRFEISLSPGVCLLHAVAQSRVGGEWRPRERLDEREAAAMDRLGLALGAALTGSLAGAPAPASTPAPAPQTPLAAARNAMERAGLHVESASEADGRLESSWRESEAPPLGVPTFGQPPVLSQATATGQTAPVQIYYRVRYLVQVSGRSASARAEVQKSTDELSWVARSGTTRKEEETLEKLRRSLREELDALPPQP